MKKTVIVLFVLLLIIGCKNERIKEPGNLINKDKMVDIMYDMSLLDAMKLQNFTFLDSIKGNSNEYIFKKYKIDSIQFAQSNIYYAADANEYEKMYTLVKIRIDNNKTKINAVLKAKARKDSLNTIAKNKLKLKKEKDSIKKAKKLKVSKKLDSLQKKQKTL